MERSAPAGAYRARIAENGPSKTQDLFYCRSRRRRLELDKCLDDYLNANAFGRNVKACYRCPQGRLNRQRFAESP